MRTQLGCWSLAARGAHGPGQLSVYTPRLSSQDFSKQSVSLPEFMRRMVKDGNESRDILAKGKDQQK